MTVRYIADLPALRIATPLDGLTVIYHRPSGMTHLVSEPVPEILEAMGEVAMTAGEILARLADLHELSADIAALEDRLSELCETGLIARIADAS